jgi:hypothetical protein
MGFQRLGLRFQDAREGRQVALFAFVKLAALEFVGAVAADGEGLRDEGVSGGREEWV